MRSRNCYMCIRSLRRYEATEFSVILTAWVVAVLMKDLVMNPLLLLLFIFIFLFCFYFPRQTVFDAPALFFFFLFCANLFHCTVRGCIRSVSVLTLCKLTVFFCIVFIIDLLHFYDSPITIKYKTATLSRLIFSSEVHFANWASSSPVVSAFNDQVYRLGDLIPETCSFLIVAKRKTKFYHQGAAEDHLIRIPKNLRKGSL